MNRTVVTVTYTVIAPKPKPSLLPAVTCWTIAVASLVLLLTSVYTLVT